MYDGGAAFGVAESTDAFATVQQALFEGMRKQVDILDVLSDKTSASATNYRTTDEAHAEVFR